MILDETVELKVSPFNEKYWRELGYVFPKPILALNILPTITVKISDLSVSSKVPVNCLCRVCNEKFTASVSKNTDNCPACKHKVHSDRLKGRPSSNKGKTYPSSSGENHYKHNPNRSDFMRYKSKVGAVTRKQDISTLENYDKPRGISGTPGVYQLDHIKSIKQGWKEGISPEEIGDISNLQFLPWLENTRKGAK